MKIGNRLMLLEAVCVLAVAKLAVRFFFPRVAPWVTRPSASNISVPSIELQRAVERSVVAGGRIVPWDSTCLPNAIAGKLLLARRGYSSTVRLGASLREGSIAAHAWLDVQGNIVVGMDGMQEVTAFPLSRVAKN